MKRFFVLALAFLSACGGEGPIPTGDFTVIFNNQVEFAPMIFNTPFAYSTEEGDLFKVSGFRYLISHVELHKKGGGSYKLPMTADGTEGFFLVDQADPESRLLKFPKVPAGDYEAVSFQIGFALSEIDTATAKGALAKASPMWLGAPHCYAWLQFEGNLATGDKAPISAQMADASGQSAIRAKVLFTSNSTGTPQLATVRTDISPIVELTVDAYELFASPHAFRLSATPNIGISETARLSANFSDAFGFDHLHN